MSRPGRRASAIARGLGAIVVLAAVLAGLPVLLAEVGGSPLPRHIPDLAQITSSLARRDNGTLFLGAVRDIAWVAWAVFALATLAEAQAALRRRPAPRRLAGLGGMQNTAARLIALAALTFSSPAGILLTAAHQPGPVATATPLPPSGEAASVAPHEATLMTDSGGLSPARSFRVVSVRPGDCLWTIAERYLGAGDRYPEIVRLNIGRDMGRGQTFTNPALIMPGWRLRLPGGAHNRTSHDSRTQPATGLGHHQGHSSRDPLFSAPHTAAPATSPAADASPVAHAPAAPAPAAAAPDPTSVGPRATEHAATNSPGSGLTGHAPGGEEQATQHYLEVYAAGILTGGVLTALARMRHRQRQHRKLGRRIRLPADRAALQAEQSLRAAATPEHLHALTLRSALRELAARTIDAGSALPGIAGLHLTPDLLEVLLTSPAASPPAPFTPAPDGLGMRWHLQLPAMAPATGEEDDDAGDMLPGLVTAGLTDAGGYLLLDLEPLQVTTCTGPASLVDRVLATLAAELATSQLSGWYELVLVGCAELEVVEGRAQSSASFDEALDLLEARARDPGRRDGVAGVSDIRLRRVTDPDGTHLTLLVSRIVPTARDMRRLLQVAGTGGIAALVAGGASDWDQPPPANIALAADPQRPGGILAHISPLQITVRPQPLSREDYRALGSLFAAAADPGDVGADEPPYTGYGAPSWLPAASSLRPQPTQDVDAPDSGGDLGTLELEDASSPQEEPPPARDPAVPAAGPVTEAVSPCEPGPPRSAGLTVAILGPFTATGPRGPFQGAQAELVLALALSGPAGLSMSALRTMLGEDPDHPKSGDAVRQIIARTRRQAGLADDGREWVEHTGGGHYVLHEAARLDWDRFRSLADQGMRASSREHLADALALVRGEPFTGCFPWWLETPLIETVRAEIVDTADMLAGLHLAAGDTAGSARAARTGLAADRAAEQLWRALMRAEDAAGNLGGVRAAWQQCLDAIGEIAPDGDPHPDTVSLYRQLTGGPRQPVGLS